MAYGFDLPRVTEIRYLGIQLRIFKCSLQQAKCAFCRSLIAVFDRVDKSASEEVVIAITFAVLGRVGRCALEELVIQLVTQKCLPLFFGTDSCLLNKSELNSFDFAINRFLWKLFK